METSRNAALTASIAAAATLLFAAASSGAPSSAAAEPALATANTVRFDPAHPDYFGAFAPERAATLARVPAIDRESGLHVSEVKPGLFYVTEGVYQSAFLSTGEGIIVFDAPPTFGPRLAAAINRHAPDETVRYLIYSHDHRDHIGGAVHFSDVAGLEVVAAAEVAESLTADRFEGVPAPTLTFEDAHTLSLGGETVELRTASFHSEDRDTIIYLPRQKFVMAVDTITPGEVPFMNFGATADAGRYLRFFDTILAYDFDHILSGHVSILGERKDVLEAKAYAFDVRDSIVARLPSFSERIGERMAALGFKNPNLAYRAAMESIRDECAAQIIETWRDRLSVADVWADSHCETMLLYHIMH